MNESPSEYLKQRQVVQNLFAGLHEERDDKDLAIATGAKKRHSESRLKLRSAPSAPDSNTTAQDFLTPGDPFDFRTTGFSAGHVRSMMHLDTYGPKDSVETELKRAEGAIPKSPNTNKNILILSNPERKTLAESGIRAVSPQSQVEREGLSTRDMHHIQQEASYLLKNPRSRRLHWFESYQSKEKVSTSLRIQYYSITIIHPNLVLLYIKLYIFLSPKRTSG